MDLQINFYSEKRKTAFLFLPLVYEQIIEIVTIIETVIHLNPKRRPEEVNQLEAFHFVSSSH